MIEPSGAGATVPQQTFKVKQGKGWGRQIDVPSFEKSRRPDGSTLAKNCCPQANDLAVHKMAEPPHRRFHVPAIETRDLRKRYRGVEALKGVSIRVEPGEVYGLLGQNGAGKTTLVKILLGIVRSSGGAATLLGRGAGDAAARRRVGYLPEDHRFP